ncbi:AF4/FMR2 family member 4-like isoform X4 [Branchiostoma lanceolatum]|uniref:AF4/FMR2 family member 4-like isoform X4 n=1 Tax=Branchiostoma lanceolatum TaxID=7740 RepID=UPI00345508C1
MIDTSVDRVELRRQAQLQRAGMKVATETPVVSKPLFDAPVKIEPPPDDHVYRKTQETLGQFSLIRHSMLSSQNQYLLGIPKGPQTPVLNKTADSVWASKFPQNGQLAPQKGVAAHRPKQSGRSSSSERSRGRGSKSPADKRGHGRSANHKSSSSAHMPKGAADKPEDKKRQEEPRGKEPEGSRPKTSEAGHEKRKSGGASKRPSVSPHHPAKDGQGATGHSHSSKAAEPYSKPAQHSKPEKSPPVQPDSSSSSSSVKMEASSTKDDAFQMPAPLSTAPGSHRPSHSGGKGGDRAEERLNGLLAGLKKEGGEKELSREDVKRKLKLTMPDTSEQEARLNSSGGLKSAGTEKVETILKEMTEVGPPLTGIHTPIKTDVSKFPFPANQDMPSLQLSHTKRKNAAESSGGGKTKPMGPSSELKKYFLDMSDSEDDDDQVRQTKAAGRHAQKMRSPARRTPMLSSGSSSSSSGSEDSSDSDSDGSSSSDESVQDAPPPASPPKQESDTTNWGLASFVNPVKRDSPGNTFPLLVSAGGGTSTSNAQTSAALPMGLFGTDEGPLSSAGFMTSSDSHGFDVNDILQPLDSSKELDPDHKDNYSATKINGLRMKISKKGGPEPESNSGSSSSRSKETASKKSSLGKSPSAASRNSSKTAANRTPRKGADKKPVEKPASASNAKAESSEKTKANSSSKAGQTTPSNKTNWAEPSPKTERTTKTVQGKKSSDKKGKRTPQTSSKVKSKEFIDSDSESDLEVDVVNISPEKGAKASPSPRAKLNNTSKPKARDSGKKAAASSSGGSQEKAPLSVDVLSSDNSLLSPLNEPLLSPIEGDLASTVPKITYGNNGIPKSLIVSIDLSLLDRIPARKDSSRQGDSKKSGSSSESKPRSKVQKRKRDNSQSQADTTGASTTEEVHTKRPKKEKETTTDSKATPTRSLPTPTRTVPTPATSLSTPTRSLPTPTRTPTQATPTRTTPTRTPPSSRQDTEKGRGSARRSSVSSTSSRLSEESAKTDRSTKRRKVERQTSQESSKKKEKKSKKTPKKQVPSRCQDWDAPPVIVPEHSQNGVTAEIVAKATNGHAAGSQWGELAAGQAGGKTWDRHDPRGDIPYFNSKTDVEDRPLSADHYLTEAKNLKHLADGLADKNQKTLTYVDAVLYFIQCGNAMESDPHLSESKSPSTMYLETVDLIKKMCQKYYKHLFDCRTLDWRFILRFNSHHMHNQSQDQTTSDKKLAVLCLRCQSLLYMKLFKLKKDYAMKYSKALTDHFKNPPKNTQVPSPYQHNWNGARGTGTPSPMSPTPSPAGSVTSVGSQGSNNGDLTLNTPTQNKLSNGTSASSVTIPQRIHSLMQEHIKITNHLLYSQDLWEQANTLAQDNPEFFRRLDQRFGALTLHSTLIELVRYVRQGLQWLKES